MTEIWAHRGACAHAPENTMAAFALAIEHGADAVELDVHLDADGRLVVRHDEWVSMPDGSRPLLRDLDAEAIAGIDVGDERSGRAGIPLLGEVIEMLRPTGLRLNVEVKNGPVIAPGIEEAVATATMRSGMAERIVVSSFNHFSLVAIRAMAPGVDIAPLYSEGLVDPWRYVQHLGVDAVHPFVANLFAPGVADGFRDAGIRVRPWTVNDPAMIAHLVDAGVDAIITDEPAAAVAVRDARLAAAR